MQAYVCCIRIDVFSATFIFVLSIAGFGQIFMHVNLMNRGSKKKFFFLSFHFIYIYECMRFVRYILAFKLNC